jgi:small subunit ribosomal protein SAe
MVDMYFYRDPEEQEKDQEDVALEERKAIATGTGEDEYAGEAGEWGETAAIPVTTAGEWEAGATGEWAAAGGESWDAAAA